jgi:glycosyltransferase 2 family protein
MSLKIILKLCVAISLLVFIYLNINKFEAVRTLNNLSFFWIGISIFIYISVTCLNSLRIKNIISIFDDMSFLRAWEVTVTSNAATFFLLPGITSELSRFYFINSYTNAKRSEIFISLIYDRFCGAIASVFMTIIGGFFIFHKIYEIEKIIIYFSIIIFLLFVLFVFINLGKLKYIVTYIPKLRSLSYINKLIDISDQVENNKFLFLFNIFISLLIQFGAILIVYVISYDLEKLIDIRMLMLLMPGMIIIISLPITFGGIGLRELTFAAGFSLINISNEVSIIIGLNYTLLLFFVTGFLLLINEIFNFFYPTGE